MSSHDIRLSWLCLLDPPLVKLDFFAHTDGYMHSIQWEIAWCDMKSRGPELLVQAIKEFTAIHFKEATTPSKNGNGSSILK